MQTKALNYTLKALGLITLAVLGYCQQGTAQQVSLTLLHPSLEEAVPMQPSYTPIAVHGAPEQHRFWDRDNSLLFATSAAFSAADFVVTRDNLRGGGRELNPVTSLFSGTTAGLAANFVGETAGVVGLSYVFHKTGHHKLERLVSVVNIGSSAGAVAFDLIHR